MVSIKNFIKNFIIRFNIVNLEFQRKVCIHDIGFLNIRMSKLSTNRDIDYVCNQISIKKKILNDIEQEIESLKKDLS